MDNRTTGKPCYPISTFTSDNKETSMKKIPIILPTIIASTLSLILTVNEVIAGSPLESSEVISLFSGKTVDWYHEKKGFSATGYFDPDGILSGVKDNGAEFQFDWSVNSKGEFCIDKSSKTICRTIIKSGSEYHKVMVKSNGKQIHIMTYRNFVDGNPNDY